MTTVTSPPGSATRGASKEPSPLERYERERSRQNLSETERQASVFGGGALLALGLLRRSLSLTALGSYLAYRGNTGRCALYEAMGLNPARGEEGRRTTFSKTITINRSREDVFRFFQSGGGESHDVMRGIERSGSEDGNGAGRWYLRPVESLPLRWPVEMTDERENERIVWSASEDSHSELRCEITFAEAPRDLGTVVRMKMACLLPGGGPGAAAGKALGTLTERQFDQGLRRVKQYLETGEIATTEGQPSGRSVPQRVVRKLKESVT